MFYWKTISLSTFKIHFGAKIKKKLKNIINPNSAEPGYVPAFANSVDPDQLASSEEAN